MLIDPLANDSDPDGDLLTVEIQTSSGSGSVSVDTFGVLSFVPDPVPGPVSCEIRYRLNDGTTVSPDAVVWITVTPFVPEIFSDGFESGDTSAWSVTQG